MATDSTDLAFVRCPSCRSLVPAVSTKCRMCGAGLEAGAHDDDSTKPNSPSSSEKAPGGFVPVGGGVGSQESPSSQMTAQGEAVADTGEKETIDPLAAYLDSLPEDDDADDFEDLDDLEDDLDQYDDIEDDFDDIDEDIDDFETPEEVAPPQVEAIPVEPTPQPTTVEAKNTAQTKAPESKKEEKPRVVIEQGKSRQGGRSFSFSKNKEEDKQPSHTNKKVETAKAAPSHPQKKQEEYVQPAVVEDDEVIEEYIKPATQQNKSPKQPIRSAETQMPAKDAIKWTEPKTAGKLYGWLVSYVESKGASLELREGRFFVTAQALRDEDLVLDQETISTPHAMFTISSEQGVIVQDLRSDRGLFVRERDNNAYRREYDTSELRHGDWIRFGDVEFLVCLISG